MGHADRVLDHDSTPPSDSASVKTCTLSSSPKTASCPPRQAKRKRPAKAAHLTQGERVLRMRFEARMPHFAHFWPRFEPPRNR